MIDATKMTPLQLKIYREYVMPLVERHIEHNPEVESIFEKAFADCPDGDGDFRPVLYALVAVKYSLNK